MGVGETTIIVVGLRRHRTIGGGNHRCPARFGGDVAILEPHADVICTCRIHTACHNRPSVCGLLRAAVRISNLHNPTKFNIFHGCTTNEYPEPSTQAIACPLPSEEARSTVRRWHSATSDVRRLQGCGTSASVGQSSRKDCWTPQERMFGDQPTRCNASCQTRSLHGPVAIRRRISSRSSGAR